MTEASSAIKDLLMLGTILVSVGSSFAVAKFQIGRLEKSQEEMNKAVNAIGKKFDIMKNDFTENKTICDTLLFFTFFERI